MDKSILVKKQKKNIIVYQVTTGIPDASGH